MDSMGSWSFLKLDLPFLPSSECFNTVERLWGSARQNGIKGLSQNGMVNVFIKGEALESGRTRSSP